MTNPVDYLRTLDLCVILGDHIIGTARLLRGGMSLEDTLARLASAAALAGMITQRLDPETTFHYTNASPTKPEAPEYG